MFMTTMVATLVLQNHEDREASDDPDDAIVDNHYDGMELLTMRMMMMKHVPTVLADMISSILLLYSSHT